MRSPVPQKLVRKNPHAGPEVVREDFEDDISAYLDGGLPMPPPPPLTDEEKLGLLRKSKLKFQAAKDEFGAEATAWHREQLKLAARDRCVYGPGAPGAPCDGGRARVRGGEDRSTWDAAARAAQTKKPPPGPESPDVAALRAEAATGDADAQYRLGARLYGDKKERGGALSEAGRRKTTRGHARARRAYAAPVDDQIRLDLQEALVLLPRAGGPRRRAAARRVPGRRFPRGRGRGAGGADFDDHDAAATNDADASRAAHDARIGGAPGSIAARSARRRKRSGRSGMSSAQLRERS